MDGYGYVSLLLLFYYSSETTLIKPVEPGVVGPSLLASGGSWRDMDRGLGKAASRTHLSARDWLFHWKRTLTDSASPRELRHSLEGPPRHESEFQWKSTPVMSSSPLC